MGWGIDYGKAYSSSYDQRCAVTEKELAELIQQATGQEVDRREITLTSISKLGTYKAHIKLHSEVTADVEVEVVSL